MVTARLPFVPLVLFATGCGAVGASLALGYPLWAAVGVAAAGLAVWTLNRARPGAVEGLPPTRPAAVPSAPDTSGDRTADDPAASEELMRHEVGLEDVVETMAGALILASPERRIVRLNKAALDLLGDPGEELLGRPLSDIFPDERPMNSGSLLHLSTGGRMRSVERLFRHRDGSDVPVLFSGSALRGGDGELRQFVCVAYDIRPLKELEGQLRRSLGEKQLLLREVHHRVKNNLQVISSLLELQSERVEDERHLELLRDSRHRIRSMALIHEQLYRHDDLSHVALGPYLENIAGHLFRSFGIDAGRIALRCRLVEVEIDLDRAVACGLIVNELISNSLEHAFVDGASGQVGLELGAEDGGRARLVVWDDGVGFELDVDRPHSMGLELVAMMVEQLGGRLEAGGADEAEDAGRRGSRFTVEWSEAASSERGDR